MNALLSLSGRCLDRFDSHDQKWRRERGLRYPVYCRCRDVAVAIIRGENVDAVRYHSQDSLLLVRIHIILRSGVRSRQLVQQRLRLLQIARVEVFGEPAIDRSVSLVPLSLIAPKLRHAYRPRLASTISSVANARNRDRGGKQLEATIQSFERTSAPHARRVERGKHFSPGSRIDGLRRPTHHDPRLMSWS